jgi:hypothetical protein
LRCSARFSCSELSMQVSPNVSASYFAFNSDSQRMTAAPESSSRVV